MLEESDVLDRHSSDNEKQEVEKRFSPRLEVGPVTSEIAMPSCHAKETCHMSSDYAMSDSSTQAPRLSSSVSPSSALTVSSLSAPSIYEVSGSVQTQIDRLKVECLSSCLTVCLQRLDLSPIRQTHQETIEIRKAQVAHSLSLESKKGPNSRNFNSWLDSVLRDTESGEQSSVSEFQTEVLVKQMSASFMLSATSPAPIKASSKMPVAKENSGLCTSRKVCVSGLNSSRWSRRGASERNKRQRQNETRTKPGDCSSNDLLHTEVDSYIGVMYYILC